MQIVAELNGLVLPPLVSAQQLASDSGGTLKAGDPRLDAAVAAASEAVRRYCRWHVTPVLQGTLTLDAVGGHVLHLPSMRVVDVTEVKVLGELIPPEHWSWSEAGMIELHKRSFPKRFRSVEVTLTHGFDEAADLAAIVSQIARFALASPMGRTREQAGQIAVSWGSTVGMAWSESNLEMMKPYRLQMLP